MSTVVGYTGGITRNPTYPIVCGGDTGHAEAVQVMYDPNVITYAKLINSFLILFRPSISYTHPKSQYRASVFYENEDEKRIVEEALQKLNQDSKKVYGVYLEKSATFYSAEEYHQNYYKKMFGMAHC